MSKKKHSYQDEKLQRSIWTAAYLRALSLHNPVDAEGLAEEALSRHRKRWCDKLQVPVGMDPQAYRNFRAILGLR